MLMLMMISDTNYDRDGDDEMHSLLTARGCCYLLFGGLKRYNLGAEKIQIRGLKSAGMKLTTSLR